MACVSITGLAGAPAKVVDGHKDRDKDAGKVGAKGKGMPGVGDMGGAGGVANGVSHRKVFGRGGLPTKRQGPGTKRPTLAWVRG